MRTRTNIVISCLVGIALVLVFILRGAPDAAPPPLGFERVPPDEADALAKLAQTIKTIPAPAGGSGDCYDATFTVVDNLAPALDTGILGAGRQYRARVRMPTRFADYLDSARIGPAMAIKLFGLDGEFVREADPAAGTQDIILGVRPAFAYSDVSALAAALAASDAAARSPAPTAPPGTRWLSMLPYRFGDRHAVKYAARPCPFTTTPGCFEFMIQFQNDAASMPIEDAGVAWDEALSPFEPVAVLMLDVAGAAAGSDCAGLTFSPWQSLAVHAPLGGINRARRVLDRRIPPATAIGR